MMLDWYAALLTSPNSALWDRVEDMVEVLVYQKAIMKEHHAGVDPYIR